MIQNNKIKTADQLKKLIEVSTGLINDLFEGESTHSSNWNTLQSIRNDLNMAHNRIDYLKYEKK